MNFSRKIKGLLAFCVALFAAAPFSGCATIISGSEQEVKFDASLPGTMLSIDNKEYSLPTFVKLTTGDPHVATFTHTNSGTVTMTVKTHFNWWTLGNIIVWPLVFVDLATGAMWKLDETVVANMNSNGNAGVAKTCSSCGSTYTDPSYTHCLSCGNALQ
ncbi:MAG: hypothetical protein NUW37_07985 [Planctomycetes bacterium]|nr:hypothetical protein [Planctomycetota bacterium]